MYIDNSPKKFTFFMYSWLYTPIYKHIIINDETKDSNEIIARIVCINLRQHRLNLHMIQYLKLIFVMLIYIQFILEPLFPFKRIVTVCRRRSIHNIVHHT